MEDREIERILQEKADQIKVRDFSEVWGEIKDQLKEEDRKPKWTWKKWLPIALASAVLVVCIALTPFIIKSSTPTPQIPEEVFFTDELIMKDVLSSEMLDRLTQASISHVNLSSYEIGGCTLFITEKNIVKGASFDIYNNPTTFFSKVQLYDKSVDLGMDLIGLYDQTCKVNSTTVHYKFKQENGGMYEYSVYAIHNNVQYVIEYMGVSDNLSDFLNEFFA